MKRKTLEDFLQVNIEQEDGNEELFDALRPSLEEEIKEIKETIQNLKDSYNENITNYNIILFGPAGSGKSSFIKTIFNAYDDKDNKVKNVSDNLIVKQLDENEGTTKFSQFELKKGIKSKMEINGKEHILRSLGVVIYDTRGQIRLNKKEKSEIDVLIEVISKG